MLSSTANAGDKVVISIKNENESIEISVHDNGIGISESEQSNIFGKFFRAENAKKKDIIGSGLGLFTTKRIVEQYKGKIWFESKAGAGTTFFVSLPINK
jgi:signal transduction histidine kinase